MISFHKQKRKPMRAWVCFESAAGELSTIARKQFTNKDDVSTGFLTSKELSQKFQCVLVDTSVFFSKFQNERARR